MKNLLPLLITLFFIPSSFAQTYDQQSENICQAFNYREHTFTGATEATQDAILSVTWRYCGPWNGNDFGNLSLQIWVDGSWVTIVNNYSDTGNGCAFAGVIDDFTISSSTINAAVNTAPVGEILIRGQISDGCAPGVGCNFGSDPCFQAQLTYSNAVAANFSPSTDMVCLGDTVTITDESAGSNLTYDWDFGADAIPSTATGAGPHDVTYTSTGIKTISLEVENGTSTNSISQNIEIFALPSITTAEDINICPGSSTTIEAFGNGTISWDNGLGVGSSFIVSPTTTTEYVATIVDDNSCSASSSTIVNVSDIVAPVPSLGPLPDITSQCDVVELTAPTATDNCVGSVTGTHNATFPITSSTTVIWTYDDGNGNTSTQSQEVIIDDVTAPEADSGSLSDVNAECEVTSLTPPTATDNCEGTVSGTHNATFPITSSTTITWTYDDGNGNTSTQTQAVTIDDVTAPLADAGVLAEVTAECEVISLTAPTATDNCVGLVTGTHNATFPITESTTLTWTYDDGNGNTSTQTQEVIIADTTAPEADAPTLEPIIVECELNTLSAPTATDNCSGAITGTHNATFPITESTTVTWTYDDGSGNTSTQTQDVLITPIDNGITQFDAVTLEADAAGYTYQWVDCNNGNQPIDGETEQTFTAPDNGSYAVEISNGNCTVTTDCISLLTVGIQGALAKTVSVYPNPTSGIITIQSEQGLDRIQITNAIGQTVQEQVHVSETTVQLELPEPSGVYLLIVEVDGENQVTRIIKH